VLGPLSLITLETQVLKLSVLNTIPVKMNPDSEHILVVLNGVEKTQKTVKILNYNIVKKTLTNGVWLFVIILLVIQTQNHLYVEVLKHVKMFLETSAKEKICRVKLVEITARKMEFTVIMLSVITVKIYTKNTPKTSKKKISSVYVDVLCLLTL
jgi:DNA-binding TFAR19-related protein (PDSD5 family)